MSTERLLLERDLHQVLVPYALLCDGRSMLKAALAWKSRYR